MAVSVEEVNAEFKKNNFDVKSDAVAESCAALCKSFGITVSSLVASWELFYLNQQIQTTAVSSKLLDVFRPFLQEQQKTSRKRQAEVHFYSKDDFELLEEDAAPMAWEPLQSTPYSAKSKRVSGSVTPGKPPSTPSTPNVPATPILEPMKGPDTPASVYSKRGSRQVVQLAVNGHLAVPDDGGAESRQPCRVEVLGSPPEAGCRYMYDRVEDKASAIEERITAFARELQEREGCTVSHQVFTADQEKVVTVGRIGCEAEGRLNDKSVLLEGSQERVKLELRDMSSFSFFPGQVIGVEGKNPSGFCLVASRIFESLPPPRPPQATPLAAPLHVMAAAGPFSTADNLDYEPLDDLLKLAAAKRPDLLILMGPFVDVEHPLVRSGAVDRLHEHIFQEEVRARIERYCEQAGETSRVVLLPSTRDAQHFAVFPQPPLDRREFEDPSNQITCCANPAIFQCNGVTFAASTMDILKHLSSEEAARGTASSDRMARLAGHLIGQRSFYPLFPPPLGTCLDLTHTPKGLELPVTPDVILLPSDLAAFVKPLSVPTPDGKDPSRASEQKAEGTGEGPGTSFHPWCINPGRLSRGTGGGTFTQMWLLPPKKVEGDGQADCARIEVLRI